MVDLKCDMTEDCAEPVTHIDPHGFIYCTEHGLSKRSYYHLCRKLRPHELRRLQRGEKVARY